MWGALQLAILLPLLHGGGHGQTATTCPVFGETGPAGTAARTRLFMNFDSPSQCSGRVVAWNYCYWRDGEEGDTLGARFLVYRRNLTTGVYHQVPNSLYTLSVRYENLEATNNHGCGIVTLNSTNQFDIMENDIIAACIIDNNGVNPLHLTADPGELNRARQVGGSSFESCTDEQLRTITRNQFQSRENRLALHATISADSCRVGDNPEPSNPNSNPGHYLNTQFPAECDGVVTAWNYCFYPDEMSDDGTYSATVALWRPDSTTSDLYNIVEGSDSVIQTQRVRSDAHIYCIKQSFAPENYVAIRQGDVVGVLIPLNFDISMIGHSGTYGIHRDQVQRSSPSSQLSISSLNLENLRIHLYADITAASTDGTQASTNNPEGTSTGNNGTYGTTTSSKLVNPGSTTTNITEDDSGLSAGGVAGIVIFILILLVAGGAVATVLLVLFWRKKTKKSVESYPVTSSHVGVAFDNLNYTAQVSPTAAPYEDAVCSTGNGIVPISNPEYEPVEFFASSTIYSDVNPSICESLRTVPKYGTLIEQNRSEDVYAGLDPYQEPAEREELLYTQMETHSHVAMDISRRDIQLKRHLGSGQFGSVSEGVWKQGDKSIPVALKELKTGASERDKLKFLQEAATMVQFRHPNVVTMYGMVSDGEPILLVVELIEKGDLRDNLLKMRKNEKELKDPGLPMMMLEFSQHIALGMQYLSGKGFVHRDLAARNILLSKNNLCKIADFGLSRDLEDENYYTSSGGMVPVKWTAPEAIRYRKYSTASDVWSYGCVLYEIWSVGHKPFENYPNMEILGVIEAGNRLAPPPGCPRQIYQLMIRCWHPTKSDRPTFRDAILCLTERDAKVMLEIPQSALDTNPQFKNLGGPLEVGTEVYMDLQTLHCN